MKNVTFLFLLFALGFFSNAALAADGPVDPLQRLAMQGADDRASVENVIVEPAMFSSLPEYIQGQARAIAVCAGDPRYVGLIKYFSYMSDYNRAEKLPPNYILDPSNLVNASFRECAVGEICAGKQCALIGYKAGAKGWTRNFSVMMYKWSVNAPRGNQKNSQAARFDIVSVNNPLCSAQNGLSNNIGCLKRYEWRLGGLAQSLTGAAK